MTQSSDEPTRDDLPGRLTIIDAIGDRAMVTQTFHSETSAVGLAGRLVTPEGPVRILPGRCLLAFPPS